MAAKPTQDPKWVTSDDPNELIEPSPALKTNGVQSGGIWGREHLNWMFNTLSKWIDWVRSSAMDKDNNLNDVSDKVASFNNIKQNATTTTTGVVEKATETETEDGTSGKFPDAASVSNKYLKKSDNLNSVSNKTSAFNNIKQNATTTTTGVVEKATTSEMAAGTFGKFPDAGTIQTVLGTMGRGTTGYFKDKNSGFILQWGKTGTIGLGGTFTDTFAIKFPTTCLSAVCSLNTSSADNVAHVRSLSSTQIQIFMSNTGGGGGTSSAAFWFAVGY